MNLESDQEAMIILISLTFYAADRFSLMRRLNLRSLTDKPKVAPQPQIRFFHFHR
jgi:hypothetical protein